MARIDLLPHITAVKALLASIPERGAPTHKRAVAMAVDALRARGGRCQFVGGANVLSLAGVRGSSTMDEHAAIESWVKAAYRKLDRQAIARMGK